MGIFLGVSLQGPGIGWVLKHSRVPEASQLGVGVPEGRSCKGR